MPPPTLHNTALIIVDFQEDFCPPNGALAVPDGRSIAGPVNTLLALPFTITIATKDWHPPNHISFAANHAGATAFVTRVTIANPLAGGGGGGGKEDAKEEGEETEKIAKDEERETVTSLLWPVHCVQGSRGAELVPELDVARVQRVLEKGQDARVEMYSAFFAPFRKPVVADSGLTGVLRERGVEHVYVVGLATDYCVKATAIDAKQEGFSVYVIEEGVRAVDPEAVDEVKKEFESVGVKWVSMNGAEVQWLKDLQ